MNVCFAVQEMNVPMSQYIEWHHYVVFRRPVATWSPNCSTFSVFSCMRWAQTSSEPSSPLFCRLQKQLFFILLLKLIQSFKDISNNFPSATRKSTLFRLMFTWMNRLNVCLMKSLLTSEKVMIACKWEMNAPKCVFYLN